LKAFITYCRRCFFKINSKNLSLIEESNHLWEPVYPYLTQHIQELYGRQDGNILEIGPFSGVIFTLQEKKVGNFFLIAAFPPKMANYFRREAQERGVEDKIKVIESNPSLSGIEESTIDLAIFRGAFFFPSLGEANFSEIYRVLKPGGLAFMGGGFGKHTPEAVIKDIKIKSRDLNLRLGKIHIGEEEFRQRLQVIKVKGNIEFISEGGFWVLMKK
jgi:ubiquinone/menaquinone biosynthesis C-methylase UbiE